jgi:2'-5' RNA ligase
MDLKSHYDTLYKDSIKKIKTNHQIIDEQIDAPTDFRQGITLLIRPPLHIKNKIQAFLKELRKIEPKQYFYPNSDLHITTMSIISCHPDFKLATIEIPEYIKTIEQSLIDIPTFEINFKGITASPAAIMIQGFTNSVSLDNLRTNLRTNFSVSGLEQSIDKRYSIATAHTTVMRFQNKFQNKDLFLKTIEEFRDFDFGSFELKKMDLVSNDWYQKQKKVELLHRFILK